VTQLLDGGKIIDTFHQLLAQDRPLSPTTDLLENRPTLRALRDFGDLLNDEEIESMRDSERVRVNSRPTTPRLANHSPTTRRFVGIEERISQEGLRSTYFGQVPGVYQNVRHPTTNTWILLMCSVHPRAPLPLSSHHLHFALAPYSWTLPIQARRPYRRSGARSQ
jgi:hypothetical protein